MLSLSKRATLDKAGLEEGQKMTAEIMNKRLDDISKSSETTNKQILLYHTMCLGMPLTVFLLPLSFMESGRGEGPFPVTDGKVETEAPTEGEMRNFLALQKIENGISKRFEGLSKHFENINSQFTMFSTFSAAGCDTLAALMVVLKIFS